MYAFVAALLLWSFPSAQCVSESLTPVHHARALAGAGLTAAPDADEESGRKHLMVRCVSGQCVLDNISLETLRVV